jgi:predicted Zn-dependent peptidase
MILHSKFEPAEIEKERQVIIEEINRNKDSPAQQVDQLTNEILWPNHPLGDDTAGDRETVSRLTRQNMLDYIDQQYTPQNAVFAIAGDVQHETMVEAVIKSTRDWQTRQSPRTYLPYIEQPNPRIKVEKRDTEQVHLCLALPGISLFDKRRYALNLLNVVLGSGMSSRLFVEIRDKLGLAYAIHSYVDYFLDSGAITVYAGVENKNVTVAINAVLEQLTRLKQEPVPEAELTKAKELSKGRLLMRMEDSHAIAGWVGGQETLTGKILTDTDVIALFEAVTARDIQDIANELLVTEKLRLAVVGPVTDEDALEKLLKI